MAGAHNALFVNQALGIYPEDFVDAFVQVFIADVEQVGVIPDFVAGFETLVNQFLEPKDDVFFGIPFGRYRPHIALAVQIDKKRVQQG